MITKSSMLDVGSYQSYQKDQIVFGEELLIQLLLSTTEADELIADQSALQLAQQQVDRYLFAAPSLRRRVMPPRRHLRNK